MHGEFKAELNEHESEALMRKVNGEGGFQSLLRALQRGFDRRSGTLTVTAEQIERINRYTQQYGAGGFEDRLDGVRRNLPKLLK